MNADGGMCSVLELLNLAAAFDTDHKSVEQTVARGGYIWHSIELVVIVYQTESIVFLLTILGFLFPLPSR